MGTVIAVCVSGERGTPKQNVNSAYVKAGWGIDGDAHAGAWNRQVSLLSAEKIAAFNRRGARIESGAFGENLVVQGIDFRTLPIGTLLRCGDVLLEITQTGKECHNHCAIYHRMGDCIMPREGIFARALQSGVITAGDTMTVEPPRETSAWRAAVITVSDKCARGERTDEGGPAVAALLREKGYSIIETLVLPDDRAALENNLIRLCDYNRPDLILTTGGTGFSPRDITPEATLAASDRQASGIAEAIRAASMTVTPRAMLSRAAAVIRGQTLIINLPGSPQACIECMNVFIDVIPHAMGLLRGEVINCAKQAKECEQ